MTAVAEQVESASMSAEGFIGRIPVRNLWLLMLYASDLFRQRGSGKVGLEDSPDDLPDLSRLCPPGGNSRLDGVEQSYFAQRQRGELPETY